MYRSPIVLAFAALFVWTSEPSVAAEASATVEDVLVDAYGGDGVEALAETLEAGEVGDGVLDIWLLRAAAAGKSQMAEELLRAGADVNARGEDGYTPLLATLLGGHTEIAVVLLRAGADPALQAEDGTTAGDLAILLNAQDLARELAFAADDLHTLARLGADDAVRALVAEGAEVDRRDEVGWTSLMHASLAGRSDVVKLLVEHGADVKLMTTEGSTALAAATLGGDEATVRNLLDIGADVDAIGEGGHRPLMIALAAGNEALARLLLEHGAEPGRVGDDNVPPAAVAASVGLDDLAVTLKTKGQKPSVDALAAAIADGDLRAVKALLEAGVDLSEKTKEGWKPFHLAVLANNSAIVGALAEHDPDLSGRGPDGDTVLHTAIRAGASARILGDLERVAAEGNIWVPLLESTDPSGKTPLLLAVTQGAVGTVNRLLQYRKFLDVSMDEPDQEGLTPVMAAAVGKNGLILRALLEAGFSSETPAGLPTLQDYARMHESWELLAALPDDRVPPVEVHPGMSRRDRGRLQSWLKTLGYYGGAIDGVLGSGSAAALRQLSLDRRNEIMEMANASRWSDRWWKDVRPKRDNGGVILRVDGPREDRAPCSWRLDRWHDTRPNWATEFVGCVEGGAVWNANGFGVVKYNGSSDYQVAPFGDKGWDSEEVLD